MNQRKCGISKVTEAKVTTNMATTRSAAKLLGETKYYTGKPCAHGHVTYRYTASGFCAECASTRAKTRWATGERQVFADRPAIDARWNNSEKAKAAKQKWKERDPKRAWAVYARGGAKTRSGKFSVPFDLPDGYILSITPDYCPVFGTPFTFIGNVGIQDDSATLDRLTPSKGYVVGNVAVVSMKANRIKNAYGSADIRSVADWLKGLGL